MMGYYLAAGALWAAACLMFLLRLRAGSETARLLLNLELGWLVTFGLLATTVGVLKGHPRVQNKLYRVLFGGGLALFFLGWVGLQYLSTVAWANCILLWESGVYRYVIVGRAIANLPMAWLFLVLWLRALLAVFPSVGDSKADRPAEVENSLLDPSDKDTQALTAAYAIVAQAPNDRLDATIDQFRTTFQAPFLEFEGALVRDVLTTTAVGGTAGGICKICQAGVGEGQRVTAIGCAHQFHAECLLQWLGRHVHCPVCRLEYRETLVRVMREHPGRLDAVLMA